MSEEIDLYDHRTRYDPILFTRLLLREYGLKEGINYETHNFNQTEFESIGPEILMAHFPTGKLSDGVEMDLSFGIGYYDVDAYGRDIFKCDNPPSQLLRFLKNRSKLEHLTEEPHFEGERLPSGYGKFSFENGSISNFGSLGRKIGLSAITEYARAERGPRKEWDFCTSFFAFDNEPYYTLNKCIRELSLWGDEDNEVSKRGLRRYFEDVEDTTYVRQRHIDYRPYFHRLLEVYLNIHGEQAHNPNQYAEGRRLQDPFKIADYIVPLLFNGEERERIEAQLRDAKLTTRNWASIPRLSLGAIKLPTPGQKKENASSEYLFESASCLLNILTLSGANRDEAEKVVAQGLLNRYIQGPFQLSRQTAEEVIGSLKGSKELVRAVA